MDKDGNGKAEIPSKVMQGREKNGVLLRTLMNGMKLSVECARKLA